MVITATLASVFAPALAVVGLGLLAQTDIGWKDFAGIINGLGGMATFALYMAWYNVKKDIRHDAQVAAKDERIKELTNQVITLSSDAPPSTRP